MSILDPLFDKVVEEGSSSARPSPPGLTSVVHVSKRRLDIVIAFLEERHSDQLFPSGVAAVH
jgi:hypothetical protein